MTCGQFCCSGYGVLTPEQLLPSPEEAIGDSLKHLFVTNSNNTWHLLMRTVRGEVFKCPGDLAAWTWCSTPPSTTIYRNKRKEAALYPTLYPCRPQLVRWSFTIWYIKINSPILFYFNGKRSLYWLWSTWVQSCFHDRSIQYSHFYSYFPFFLSLIYLICCITVERWRTTQLVGCRISRAFRHFSNLFVVHSTHQHMPGVVAILTEPWVPQSIHILLLLLALPMYGKL